MSEAVYGALAVVMVLAVSVGIWALCRLAVAAQRVSDVVDDYERSCSAHIASFVAGLDADARPALRLGRKVLELTASKMVEAPKESVLGSLTRSLLDGRNKGSTASEGSREARADSSVYD